MNTTINRSTPPPSVPIENISIREIKQSTLANGIPLYSLSAGVQDVVKMELIFPNTNFNPEEPLLFSAANRLLSEGTSKHNAQQLAEMIDDFGAFYETSESADFCSVEVHTLNKHLSEVLPILFEIVTDAVFPESELGVYKQNNKQRLIVENEKVNSIARRKFGEIIFGNKHPYGFYVNPEDYDKLQQSSIKTFHKIQYTGNHCKMIVSGMVKDNTLKGLNDVFGKPDWMRSNGTSEKASKINASPQKKTYIEKENAVQSAIRVGKLMFNKTHPDYHGMLVLNTLLGGYFGSRLMKNIREDKGYTYGIGSAMVSMRDGGYFFVASEVGADVCNAALGEIYKEIALLRTEPVSEEELQMVKNYMLGSFLKSIDGAFNLADRWKGLMFYNLGYDYYYRFIETIKSITPHQIMELAQKHFTEDSFYELVVGKK
jgi:predicted Zn-dependent peptidase